MSETWLFKYAVLPDLLEEVCTAGQLSSGQAQIAAQVHDEYWRSMIVLDREATRALDAAGRAEKDRKMQELLAMQVERRTPDEPISAARRELESELASINLAVLKVQRDIANRSDRLLEQFFLDVQAATHIQPEQREQMERSLRRRLFLQSTRSSSKRRLQLNLHDLLMESFGADGPLNGLRLNHEEGQQLEELRDRYDLAIDGFLVRQHHARRSRPLQPQAVIHSDDPLYWERLEEMASESTEVWTIQRSFIDAVAGFLNGFDEADATEWRRFVYRHVVPPIYAEFDSMKLYRWLYADSGFPRNAERVQFIETVSTAFRAEHERLCTAAVESAIKVECDPAARFGGDATDETALRYAKDAFAIHRNGASYIQQIMSILSSDERAQVRRFLRPGKYWINLGPDIHPTAAAVLEFDEELNAIRTGVIFE